ncbi:MAG: hypothetical protein ACJ71P_16555 [Nitrososphaeraceae archaeon]
MHAEEYHRPDYNEMLSTVHGLMSRYDVDKVYIDGANPSFIKSLKLQIGEEADYMLEIHKAKQENRKPDRFDKLITALRTAVDNDGTLDKDATSYNDIFDAFRLALKFYHYEDSSESD